MAAVSKLEDLEDEVSRDLAWRKKEINALKSAVSRATAQQSSYCRAGTVLLSAHWEGFLKSATQSYVDYVFSQGLTVNQLTAPFVAIFFYKDVKNASGANFPGSDRHHIKLARKIVDSIGVPCVRPGWQVDTQGNPSSKITSDVLSSVGLSPKLGMDDGAWSVAQVFLDSQLLKDRHKVAHGERFVVDSTNFKERANRIIDLCEQLSTLVRSAAVERKFLKSS